MAGTAPASRMASSQPKAARRLWGAGSPWATIEVSSATTGRPAASASATALPTCMGELPPRAGRAKPFPPPAPLIKVERRAG